MEEDREMTAKEFADIYGKHGSWGTRLAKKAQKMGKTYPRKRGHYWFATRSEWEEVLRESGIQLRDRQSYRREEKEKKDR